ncbi:MAG: cell division protein ZapB [SAR324 cluster bacterium]|nr:cell division protein ZapB [SAR324 cluster bacterium]
MSEDLVKKLEEKVENAVEMIEFLREEVAELSAENDTLKEARSQWEEKLTNLIGKFEQLEDEEDSEEDLEAHSTSTEYGPSEQSFSA